MLENLEKINALINLLDDPDEAIFLQVESELLSLGQSIVPQLESHWEKAFDAALQHRIEQIIHKLQLDSVKKAFIVWKESEDHNLLDAAIILAKYQYADIEENKIHEFVDQLTQDIWIELNTDYTAMEKAGVLNKIFFEIYGFSGNKKNFHSPRNCYINNVLESRKGSPISLSLLYLEIANRLKIPIYGVNLPEHFVLAYTKLPVPFGDLKDQDNILFYINLFNKGSFFQYKDLELFLKQLKLEAKEEFYLPCDSITVVKRLINNLIFCYSKSGYDDKMKDLIEIRKSLD